MTYAAIRRHAASLALACTFVSGLALASVVHAAGDEVAQRPAAVATPASVVTRPDSSTAGWRTLAARVSVVSSSRSRTALRVASRRADGRFAVYASPRPVTWAGKRAGFVASAYVRGTASAGKLCLTLREISRGRAVRVRSSCRPASRSWQRLAVPLTTSRRGSQVGVLVTGRAPGAYEVDDLVVGRTRAPAAVKCRPRKKCAPPPPPTTTTTTTTTTTDTTTTAPPPPPPPPTTTTTTTTAPPPPPPPPATTPLFLASGSLSSFDHYNEPGGSSFTELDGAYRAVTGAGSSNIYARGVQPIPLRGDGTEVWYGARIFLGAGFYAAAVGWIDAPIRLINWKEYGSGNKDNAGISFRIWSGGGDGRIELRTWRDTSPARTHVVGPRLTEASWHRIDVHQRFSSTNPYSALYVDGQLIGEHTGANWSWDRPFVLSDLQCGIVGAYNNPNPLTMLVDDCYLGTSRYLG